MSALLILLKQSLKILLPLDSLQFRADFVFFDLTKVSSSLSYVTSSIKLSRNPSVDQTNPTGLTQLIISVASFRNEVFFESQVKTPIQGQDVGEPALPSSWRKLFIP